MTNAEPSPFEGARLLDELSPATVESYLSLTGWDRTFYRDGVNSVWDRGDASLMLPYDPDFSDFQPRFSEALHTISIVESLRGEPLALEILSSENDIIFLRADQGVTRGSIPLSEAEQLVSGARQMLLAAACSAIDRRANFRGRKPAAARNFAEDGARMGHTLQGSFVLTILASILPVSDERSVPDRRPDIGVESEALTRRVDPEAEQEVAARANGEIATRQTIRPVVPYSRRATSTLASGLHAAEMVLRDDPGIDLGTAVERGASAELFDSIELMGSFEGLQALDLSFKWAKSVPQAEETPSRTVFPRGQIDSRALEVSASLRQRDVKGRFEVLGKVVQLERGEDAETGTVVVEGYMGNTRRKVRASFSGEQYQTAIRAHETRATVTILGQVAPRGNRYWLTDAILWLVRDENGPNTPE